MVHNRRSSFQSESRELSWLLVHHCFTGIDSRLVICAAGTSNTARNDTDDGLDLESVGGNGLVDHVVSPINVRLRDVCRAWPIMPGTDAPCFRCVHRLPSWVLDDQEPAFGHGSSYSPWCWHCVGRLVPCDFKPASYTDYNSKHHNLSHLPWCWSWGWETTAERDSRCRLLLLRRLDPGNCRVEFRRHRRAGCRIARRLDFGVRP